jgi:hypothetical protein
MITRFAPPATAESLGCVCIGLLPAVVQADILNGTAEDEGLALLACTVKIAGKDYATRLPGK